MPANRITKVKKIHINKPPADLAICQETITSEEYLLLGKVGGLHILALLCFIAGAFPREQNNEESTEENLLDRRAISWMFYLAAVAFLGIAKYYSSGKAKKYLFDEQTRALEVKKEISTRSSAIVEEIIKLTNLEKCVFESNKKAKIEIERLLQELIKQIQLSLYNGIQTQFHSINMKVQDRKILFGRKAKTNAFCLIARILYENRHEIIGCIVTAIKMHVMLNIPLDKKMFQVAAKFTCKYSLTKIIFHFNDQLFELGLKVNPQFSSFLSEHKEDLGRINLELISDYKETGECFLQLMEGKSWLELLDSLEDKKIVSSKSAVSSLLKAESTLPPSSEKNLLLVKVEYGIERELISVSQKKSKKEKPPLSLVTHSVFSPPKKMREEFSFVIKSKESSYPLILMERYGDSRVACYAFFTKALLETLGDDADAYQKAVSQGKVGDHHVPISTSLEPKLENLGCEFKLKPYDARIADQGEKRLGAVKIQAVNNSDDKILIYAVCVESLKKKGEPKLYSDGILAKSSDGKIVLCEPVELVKMPITKKIAEAKEESDVDVLQKTSIRRFG